ncbi:MADS-box protein [Ancistrocladus abbreviatus]
MHIAPRKLLGEGVESCTIQELQQLENQLERSVSRIRAQKNQVFNQQIQQLKEKFFTDWRCSVDVQMKLQEKLLMAEHGRLCGKYGLQPGRERPGQQSEDAASEDHSQVSEVETDLFIGLPESRNKHLTPRK